MRWTYLGLTDKVSLRQKENRFTVFVRDYCEFGHVVSLHRRKSMRHKHCAKTRKKESRLIVKN
jgi:hypothetical protein